MKRIRACWFIPLSRIIPTAFVFSSSSQAPHCCQEATGSLYRLHNLRRRRLQRRRPRLCPEFRSSAPGLGTHQPALLQADAEDALSLKPPPHARRRHRCRTVLIDRFPAERTLVDAATPAAGGASSSRRSELAHPVPATIQRPASGRRSPACPSSIFRRCPPSDAISPDIRASALLGRGCALVARRRRGTSAGVAAAASAVHRRSRHRYCSGLK